jgi:hypothetical protein
MSTATNADGYQDEEPFHDYDIHFAITRPLLASNEPSEYLLDIMGNIHFDTINGGSNIIGRISARVVQAGRAIDARESLFEVCDCVDQNLHDYASAAYDFDNSCIRESISDGCAGTDILIIENVQIVRAHRGRGLGLLAVRRAIDTFGAGCAAVILKPFPLQFSDPSSRPTNKASDWEARMDTGSFESKQSIALTKLRRHWNRLGFQRIGRSDYFALDLQAKQRSLRNIIQNHHKEAIK